MASSDPKLTYLSNEKIITFSELHALSGHGDHQHHAVESLVPVELWDAKTGNHIARLDVKKSEKLEPSFFGNGRWVLVHDSELNLYVFSSEDGRSIAHLNGVKDGRDALGRFTLKLSPSRRQAAAFSKPEDSISSWDTATWQLTSTVGIFDYLAGRFEWISDDEIVADSSVYRFGSDKAIVALPGTFHSADSSRLLLDNGQLFDTQTWKRVYPPKGRRYHPDIARFALDDRFIQMKEDEVVDAQTEKLFHLACGMGDMGYRGSLDKYDPETGWIGRLIHVNDYGLRLPPPDHLNIDTDLLELWAKVVVRGELNDEGTFVKWNEETWEKKRQELASKPAPYADFPFPGHVAQDRLHWLRKEYEAASEAEQPRLARQLLDRAELAGDASEATRWRAVLAPKVSPPAGAK